MMCMDAAGVRRIEGYFSRIGVVLGNKKRRASFAIYAMGLLGEASARASSRSPRGRWADPEEVNAVHQRLCISSAATQSGATMRSAGMRRSTRSRR